MRRVRELTELRRQQVRGLLADVDGAVADPLDRARDDDHPQTPFAQLRLGHHVHEPFDEAAIVSQEQAADLVALDDALTSLEAMDERKARIVELRYIGGLNIEETAEVLAISPATVQREWRAAKAWLYREIKKEAGDEA